MLNKEWSTLTAT